MEGCWHFHGQRDKALTVGIMGILLLMTTLDMLFDWVNLSHLQSMEFRHTLVVGPPPHSAVSALLFFNILGTLTFVVECYNTFTILTHARHTRIPIVYEQAAILLIEEIPMASINLSIITCRQHHIMSSQLLAGIFGMLNVASRLYLYGWYREQEYGIKEVSTYKTTFKVAVYVTVSVLFLALMITCVFTWQPPWVQFEGFNAPDGQGAHWLPGVSIILISRPYWEKPQNFSFDPFIEKQGLNPERPWLTENIDFLFKDPKKEIYVQYPCVFNRTVPHMCDNAQLLQFHFQYFGPSSEKPFGGIHYNFAAHRNDAKCVPSDRNLHGNWTLTYLKIRKEWDPYSKNFSTIVHPPWDGTCSLPTPEFDTDLKIC
jgi:hypothetical protein